MYGSEYKEYYKRDAAHPWSARWATMEYSILDKDELLKRRYQTVNNFMAGKSSQKKISKKKLELPHTDYIIPDPYADFTNNKPKFYDLFMDYFKRPKSVREIPINYDFYSNDDIKSDFSDEDIEYKRDSYNLKHPPYMDLINLDLDNKKKIMEFVSNKGLLGIFFHRYNYIPAVDPEPPFKVGKYDNYNVIDANVTFNYDYTKKGTRNSFQIDVNGLYGLWFMELGYKDQLVPATNKQINDNFFPLIGNPYETQFMLHELHQDYEERSIDQITTYGYEDQLEKLFTSNSGKNRKYNKKESLAYDHDSPSSWYYTYSEPLMLFVEEATKFKKIFADISECKKIIDTSSTLNSDERNLFIITLANLKQNLRNVSPKPFFDLNTRMIRFDWRIPSLISAYYLMFYLDITGNKKTRICARPDCKKAFIAMRNDNIYCETRCQEVQKKRKQREVITVN